MAHHVQHRVVVHAPFDHGVDLDGVEACVLRSGDAIQHRLRAVPLAVHHAEYRRIERVEAHGEAAQPGAPQRLRLLREQVAVRREREIVDARDGVEHRDEPVEVLPNERFAAGDAHLADAKIDEQPGEARYLLVRQDRFAGEEVVALAVHLRGHAVGAAEVAAVGDGDAQVAHRPPERIGDLRGHRAASSGARSRISAAMRRAACPRWLIASFSAGLSSAIVFPKRGT